MTDIDHPKMAGSGRDESEGTEPQVESSETQPPPAGLRKHKRAHSRNKSISGRQDFLEEIANGEFKKGDPAEKEPGGELESGWPAESKEKDQLLSEKKEKEEAAVCSPSLKRNGKLDYDETDALPENLRYNVFDLLCTLISIGE